MQAHSPFPVPDALDKLPDPELDATRREFVPFAECIHDGDAVDAVSCEKPINTSPDGSTFCRGTSLRCFANGGVAFCWWLR